MVKVKCDDDDDDNDLDDIDEVGNSSRSSNSNIPSNWINGKLLRKSLTDFDSHTYTDWGLKKRRRTNWNAIFFFHPLHLFLFSWVCVCGSMYVINIWAALYGIYSTLGAINGKMKSNKTEYEWMAQKKTKKRKKKSKRLWFDEKYQIHAK